MKVIISCGVILLLLTSTPFAENHEFNEIYFESCIKRIDDLTTRIHNIKSDVLSEVRAQQSLVREHLDTIDRLNIRVKELESDLFQTTQSLRNLELELWDMKKTLSQRGTDKKLERY